MSQFKPTRVDGRSDRRVVYELIKDAGPGTAFGHEQLTAALQQGIHEPIGRGRETRAARAAGRTLLVQDKRALVAVPGQGYRVAFAEDHLELAQDAHHRSVVQLRKGVNLLENVRDDELSNTQRQFKDGVKLIFNGLYGMVRHVAWKQARTDAAVADILRRLNGDTALPEQS